MEFVLELYAQWRASSFSTWKISRSTMLYKDHKDATVTCLFLVRCCARSVHYGIRYVVHAHVQRKTHVLHTVDHADHTVSTRQHERDHTDQECVYLSLKNLDHGLWGSVIYPICASFLNTPVSNAQLTSRKNTWFSLFLRPSSKANARLMQLPVESTPPLFVRRLSQVIL